MSASRLSQLEGAVDRLLQRNTQLREHCQRLLAEQDGWQQQRRDLLIEVETLLADLELLRGEQS